MARDAGKPVLALCGITDPGLPRLTETFDCVLPIRPLARNTEEAISNAAGLIERVIEESEDLIRSLLRSTN